MNTDIPQTLLRWLESRLAEDSFRKLQATYTRLREGAEDWEVYSSFSGVPRHTGKEKLSLTDAEKKEAAGLRENWMPEQWTIDQLGRSLLVLAIAGRSRGEFLDKYEKLHVSADMGESEALYRCLPLLPWPEELKERAAEGIRSNITSVFHAVALDNPYPAEYLGDDAWNQMVLKALFVGSPLYRIQGIDRRANEELARMLVEYAHERWSAGRSVSPELWRPVGPFMGPRYLKEAEKALSDPDALQRQAALLALKSSASQEAARLLEQQEATTGRTGDASTDWESIGKTVHAQT